MVADADSSEFILCGIVPLMVIILFSDYSRIQMYYLAICAFLYHLIPRVYLPSPTCHAIPASKATSDIVWYHGQTTQQSHYPMITTNDRSANHRGCNSNTRPWPPASVICSRESGDAGAAGGECGVRSAPTLSFHGHDAVPISLFSGVTNTLLFPVDQRTGCPLLRRISRLMCSTI